MSDQNMIDREILEQVYDCSTICIFDNDFSIIYCNNNFTDNIAPVRSKRARLALNIPTFINLYGYGYENIYELGILTETTNADVNWSIGEIPL